MILKTGFDEVKVSPSQTEDGIITEDKFPFIQYPKNLEEPQRWQWQALHQETHFLQKGKWILFGVQRHRGNLIKYYKKF